MALPKLDQLLALPTQDQVMSQEVLPALSSEGITVTGWLKGQVLRTLAFIVAKMRSDNRVSIAAIAAAGFEDYAFGFATAPNGIDVTGWAPVIAKQRYGLTQLPAQFKQYTITLTNSTGSTYTPAAGGLIIMAPSGNRYINSAAITIPNSSTNGGVVTATFHSEFPATAGTSYNTDGDGLTWTFVTASYPGVVATNPAGNYSAVTLNGSSTGTIAASGSPTGTHTVAIKITTSGTVAGSSVGWSTSFDGGAYVTQSGSTATNLGGAGINVTLSDGAGTPSFLAGDVYSFSTPGTSVLALGAAAETPQQLGTRCRALWPLLASAQDSSGNWIPVSPTASAYAALAVTANAQCRIVLPSISNINNQVVLTVAGQGAVLPPSAVSNLGSYFSHFSMITDSVIVQSPATRAITLAGGTIYCKAAQIVSAQTALQASLSTYFQGLDSQALSINGRIDHAWIAALIRTTPGVTKYDDTALTINGSAADLQLPVTPGATELAQWTGSVKTAFTWAAA